MDPLEVGQLALRGVMNNDLYILSQPEWEPLMREWHEALVAATPKSVCPNEERLSTAREMTQASIYNAELNRTRWIPTEHKL